MTNPIPVRVRGWLYVAGIVVGAFVAVVLPDLLVALGAGPAWTAFATRGVGALTVLLATLGRANLGDVAVLSAEVEHVPADEPEAL